MILFLFFTSLFSDSLSFLHFRTFSVATLSGSVSYQLKGDSLVLLKEGYFPNVRYDSLYQYISIDSLRFIRLPKEKLIRGEITSYLTSPKDHWPFLGQLRSSPEFHDAMFYFAGLERYKHNETYKAWYNLNKARELGVFTKEGQEILNNLNRTLNKPETITPKNYRSELVEELLFMPIPPAKPFTLPYTFYTLLILIIGGITGSYLLSKKREEVLIPTPEPKKKVSQKKATKAKKTEKKPHYIDVQEKKEKLLETLDQIDRQEEEITHSETPLQKKRDPIRELSTEHLNHNNGEVQLALNLQSIKRRNTKQDTKYNAIHEMYQQNISKEEIAKRLNITITEVDLFISFKT